MLLEDLIVHSALLYAETPLQAPTALPAGAALSRAGSLSYHPPVSRDGREGSKRTKVKIPRSQSSSESLHREPVVAEDAQEGESEDEFEDAEEIERQELEGFSENPTVSGNGALDDSAGLRNRHSHEPPADGMFAIDLGRQRGQHIPEHKTFNARPPQSRFPRIAAIFSLRFQELFMGMSATDGRRSPSPDIEGYDLHSQRNRRRTSSISDFKRNQSLTSRFLRAFARLPALLRLIFILGGLSLSIVVYYIFRYHYALNVKVHIFFRDKTWKPEPAAEMSLVSSDPPPLKGCFRSHEISALGYNYSALVSQPMHNQLQAGFRLSNAMDCFDFSSTIKSFPMDPASETLLYHTYWRSDLNPFSARQASTVRSFLATQTLTHSKMIIWSNEASQLSAGEHLSPLLRSHPNYLEVRQVNISTMAAGTELGGMDTYTGDGVYDKSGWVDGDIIRLLALWHFGGLWMDMDMILTRDLNVLAEQEFLMQWDCRGQ